MTDLHRLTIAESSRLIRDRKLSPYELTRALIDRAVALDGQIHSFITPTFESALATARTAEADIMAGRYRGPLHGISYGVKDLFYTNGVLTTGNSRVGSEHIPSYDATVVEKLSRAGAILLGKQTAHELAHGGPSPELPWPLARNPWDTSCSPGGSSSGSGAAVASGFMPMSMGTDTGGSVRGPAALCGLVGLKPTYGRVSRYGVIPHSFSMDHCGPITRTIEDCALVLQAIAGFDPRDPASADERVPDYSLELNGDIRGMRIGVLRHLWEEDTVVTEELSFATEEALKVLRRLGARTEDARIRHPEVYSDVKTVICESEAFAVQRTNLRNRVVDFGDHYRNQILRALYFQGSDFIRAQRARRMLTREMREVYQKFDVLLTIGRGPAVTLNSMIAKGHSRSPNLTAPFNVTGLPAVMLCCGFSRKGLPMGMQMAAAPFAEARLFRVAHAYQQATGWHLECANLQKGAQVEPIQAPEAPMHTAAAEDCETAFRLARLAGIALGERHLNDLALWGREAREIAARIPDSPWEEEPASVFYA